MLIIANRLVAEGKESFLFSYVNMNGVVNFFLSFSLSAYNRHAQRLHAHRHIFDQMANIDCYSFIVFFFQQCNIQLKRIMLICDVIVMLMTIILSPPYLLLCLFQLGADVQTSTNEEVLAFFFFFF